MGSLVTYDDMDRVYEETGAVVIRRPWGRSYDETIGPDPGGAGVAYPALGMLLPYPRTTARWVESPCGQPWMFEKPELACEAWKRDCEREASSPGLLTRIAKALGL